MVENAYGKINLYLDITGKKPDGYHEVETYMISCSLHDVVTLEITNNSKIEISATSMEIPCDHTNLCYKAANRFFEYFSIENPGVKIHIEQHIPSGTGLGSASTDAAATLRCLTRMFNPNISAIELEKLSNKLSADMAYCIQGGCKIGKGIGEILSDGPLFPRSYIVIAKPKNESFNTKEMYELLDRIYQKDINTSLENLLCAISQNNLTDLRPYLYNAFEQCIESNSQIWKIKEIMSDADCNILTGSGSGVVALCSSYEKAEALYNKLCAIYDTYLCNSL